MCVNLLGYSERGMVNALCDDMARNGVGAVSTFLSWFDFPGLKPDFTQITNATLLVEQSFSDFGDLDLLILVENSDKSPQAIFIEAKVSNDTRSWATVEYRWDEFVNMLDGADLNTSNLFVQLYRKVRLVSRLSSDGDFHSDLFLPRGSTGTNTVVKNAVKKLRTYIKENKVWFGAILPDDSADLEAFSRDTLPTGGVIERLPSWDASRWGFLSWRAVDENTRQNWSRTQAAFEWNKGQIYRQELPLQLSVQVGQVYERGGTMYYVVLPGHGNECGAAALDGGDNRYFWKTEKVKIDELSACKRPVLTEVPSLPSNGVNYIWDSGTDQDRLPLQTKKESIEIQQNAAVTVVRASWYTSRVRIAGSSDQSTFRVYTHHLKRPENATPG